MAPLYFHRVMSNDTDPLQKSSAKDGSKHVHVRQLERCFWPNDAQMLGRDHCQLIGGSGFAVVHLLCNDGRWLTIQYFVGNERIFMC